MNDEVLTIDEAASVLKVAPEVVRNLLLSDEVPGRQIGGEWRTTKRALVSYVDGVPLQVACCPPGACCTDSELAMANANCCSPNANGGRC